MGVFQIEFIDSEQVCEIDGSGVSPFGLVVAGRQLLAGAIAHLANPLP